MSRYLFFIGLIFSIIFTGCGGGGGSSTPTTTPVNPQFTSTNSISVDENQTSVLTVTTNKSTMNYSLSGTDSTSLSIGATSGILTFNSAPDYETKSTYSVKVIATDSSNNTIEQDITITINDLDDTFEIKSTMYDDKETSSVNDDVLYIYFDKAIDQNSIASDASSNFTITGTGAIGSASTITYEADFNRLKIELNSTGTASSVFSASDTITNSTVKGSLNQDLIVGTYTINKKDVFSLLKTGQTTSYAANDDGALQRGITRSYTRDNTNEVVIDNATKLMWQDDSIVGDINSRINWADAKTYCENLSLGGFSDWILPNINQLVSITDLGVTNSSIDSTFVNIIDSNYWSSTIATFGTSNALNVTFTHGADTSSNQTSINNVRCVRPVN